MEGTMVRGRQGQLVQTTVSYLCILLTAFNIIYESNGNIWIYVLLIISCGSLGVIALFETVFVLVFGIPIPSKLIVFYATIGWIICQMGTLVYLAEGGFVQRHLTIVLMIVAHTVLGSIYCYIGISHLVHRRMAVAPIEEDEHLTPDNTPEPIEIVPKEENDSSDEQVNDNTSTAAMNIESDSLPCGPQVAQIFTEPNPDPIDITLEPILSKEENVNNEDQVNDNSTTTTIDIESNSLPVSFEVVFKKPNLNSIPPKPKAKKPRPSKRNSAKWAKDRESRGSYSISYGGTFHMSKNSTPLPSPYDIIPLDRPRTID